jgi:signal transduction histidine kinase
VPITGRGVTLGALTVVGQGRRRDRRLAERELEVLAELGRRVGRSMEHARDYRDTARARVVAEAASAAKSDFLAVLSHEIRTPLNSIVGYAQLLSDAVSGPVSAEQARQLQRIVSSADHLRVLIDEILTLSRIEAGREQVRAEPVDLCALVEEAMDIVALSAESKGLRLVRDVPAEGCVATTDRTKMLQVVVNLAGNAVKFTDHGEIGFRVRVVDGRAEVEVRDTGVGIAPEHQRRIYEPFWQVDQRAAQQAGGTGLGLSVVRHIMQLLGGGIRAESRAGGGSRFTVWVPA